MSLFLGDLRVMTSQTPTRARACAPPASSPAASGVTFVTQEDETSVINVVVWSGVAEKYRRELLGSTLMTAYGHVERIEAKDTLVVHLIAQRLVDHADLLGGMGAGSRDLH